MRVKLLFIQRREDYPGQFGPELLAAVDEFTDDENPEWFEGEKVNHLAAVGSDAVASAVVTIEVPVDQVMDRLFPERVPVDVDVVS
jgi:hypothetical protein